MPAELDGASIVDAGTGRDLGAERRRAVAVRGSVRSGPSGSARAARVLPLPLSLRRVFQTMRWIWIDKFLEFRSGQFARAIKNLTLAEEHLHDHFPGYPGDAGLADHRGAGPDRRDPGRRGGGFRREGGPGQDPPRRVLRASPAPGDQLIYEVTLTDLRSEGAVVEAKAFLDGRVARRRRDRLRPPGQLARQPDLRPQELRLHPAAPRRARPGQGPGSGLARPTSGVQDAASSNGQPTSSWRPEERSDPSAGLRALDSRKFAVCVEFLLPSARQGHNSGTARS